MEPLLYAGPGRELRMTKANLGPTLANLLSNQDNGC